MRKKAAWFIKKFLVQADNFFYKKILKNLLRVSTLGRGFVVTGAEAGTNFEYIYDNDPSGKFLIGKYVDKALLNLPSVQATRQRKDEIKAIVWNEIQNNKMKGMKTKVLDLASGGARYLRELKEDHMNGFVESVCVDRDRKCILMGEELLMKEKVSGIRFLQGDVFKSQKLKTLSEKMAWQPNIVIASGLFIYFDNATVEKIISEIHKILSPKGVLIFTSYENIRSRKLMRKTMATSDGNRWILYYRKPDYWRNILYATNFENVFVSRDKWLMNNVCFARKR